VVAVGEEPGKALRRVRDRIRRSDADDVKTRLLAVGNECRLGGGV
jgi:hypothetical protein